MKNEAKSTDVAVLENLLVDKASVKWFKLDDNNGVRPGSLLRVRPVTIKLPYIPSRKPYCGLATISRLLKIIGLFCRI